MIGELELLARLVSRLGTDTPGVLVGPGDDAAVLDDLRGAAVLATDALVEGRHWRPELSAPADVGWKALAVNVSDVAAMGARPRAAVVALHWPAEAGSQRAGELYDGLLEAAAAWDVALVGGDLVEAPQAALSVAILGEVDPAGIVRRSGARAGDALVCVGALGAASAGLAQALAGPADPDAGRADPALLAAHRRPRALPEAGRALAAHGARAMIDVSDGLGSDLGRVCQASGVSASVSWSAVPVAPGVAAAAAGLGADLADLVCGGGEDFALLAAVPKDRARPAAAAAAAAARVPGVVMGAFEPPVATGTARPQVRLELDDAPDRDLAGLGYEH